MKRVLMVSPHFPPDSGAASHRLRLLAPHLAEHGWTPTVVTVQPDDHEGRPDAELLSLVPDELDVVRVRAWPAKWTRRCGFGDLGLRALPALRRVCRDLTRRTKFDCFFVTIFPAYPALLGRYVKERAGIPFVLDYQDPWVGAWGSTTGGGKNGTPDLKSRVSRWVASRLEPLAVAAADGITAVSERTYEDVCRRVRCSEGLVLKEIPLGAEPLDFDHLRAQPRPNPLFDSSDGNLHLSYVGTMLPMGYETLRAFLRALLLVKEREPETFLRTRVHFVGTSNQTRGASRLAVLPEARREGVGSIVDEEPARLDYLDALNVLAQSTAVLLLGSSERHYTASKLYPALLSRRPVLAAFHEESTVVSILNRAARSPTVRVVTYNDTERAETRVEALYSELSELLRHPRYDESCVDSAVVDELSARRMAGRLAEVFSAVAGSP